MINLTYSIAVIRVSIYVVLFKTHLVYQIASQLPLCFECQKEDDKNTAIQWSIKILELNTYISLTMLPFLPPFCHSRALIDNNQIVTCIIHLTWDAMFVMSIDIYLKPAFIADIDGPWQRCLFFFGDEVKYTRK